MSSADAPPPPPPPPLIKAPNCPPPPPPASSNQPPLPPTLPAKISPAALRGISNSSTVTVSPMTALTQAVDRCVKFQPSLSDKAFLCYNHHTQPRLQEGPQCGLVALAMAGGEEVSVDQVQELAIKKGYTKQGEMFSVDHMADLAHTVLGRETLISDSGAVSMVEQLAAGWVLLVPYDCAHNHHPAMHGGRKAHWGLVTGFVLAVDATEDITDIGSMDGEENVNIITKIVDKDKLSQLIASKSNKLLLVGRQSKSLVLGLWDLEELISSNNNLKAIECKGELSEFMIPSGGVEAGLCGRMVQVKSR